MELPVDIHSRLLPGNVKGQAYTRDEHHTGTHKMHFKRKDNVEFSKEQVLSFKGKECVNVGKTCDAPFTETDDYQYSREHKVHLMGNYVETYGGKHDLHFSENDMTFNDNLKAKKRKCDDDEDEEGERKRLMANTQERTRMRKINKALEDLRKVLPQEFSLYHRRMSKIRTLRMAMNYIKNLSDLIIQDNLRRHHGYNTTLQYMQTAFPEMREMSSATSNIDMKSPSAAMSPMPFAAVIPVYPYLGPLCMGFEPGQSPYHTPEQMTERRPGNPRHLNFGSSPKSEMPLPPQPSCTDGIMETPVKRYRREFCHGYTKGYPGKQPRVKTETITSPLLGQRNPTEHDSSFLSSASDCAADDNIVIPALQTAGQIIPSGRTLADILNDEEVV